MKLLLPNRSVSLFFIVLLGCAVIHLLTRVYLPQEVDERPLPEFSAELQLSATDTNASLVSMLDSYMAPPAVVSEPASMQFDGRKLGQYYVELLGIYRTDDTYKAIFSLQSDLAREKQLIRLGLDEEFSGLRLTEIKARHLTIEFDKQSVTLQLFRSNQQSSTLAH